MNIWFTCNLGDPMLAGESLDHIKALFIAKCEKANCTKEMAIFFRHESAGGVHCELKVYFSPATVIVAEAVDAILCKKPASEGLGLLAGAEESWSVLFPKNGDSGQ